MFFLDFGSLWVLAYLLVGRLNVIPAVCERIALAFALALGLKSLIIFMLVAFGIVASIWVQLGVSLGALGVAVIFRWSAVLKFAFQNALQRKEISPVCDDGPDPW